MRDTRTPLEKQLGAYLRQHPEGECLEFEELLTLARRGHRARDYHRAMRHIAACPACRRAYLELRAIERMQAHGLLARLRQLWSPPTVWAPAVGVAVAAIALVWWLWMPRGTQIAQQPPRLAHPEPPMASAPSEPKRAPHRPAWRMRRPEPPSHLPSHHALPHRWSESLLLLKRWSRFSAKRQARSPRCSPAGSIRSRHPNLQAPPIRLLEPDIERNIAIAETRPTFRWQPVAQATGYTLQIREADSSRVLVETTLDATQTHYLLPPEATLARGDEYEIVLTALREGVEPLTLRRRFSVLSDEQHKRWEWAQRHERTHPLLSAMVYYYHLDRYGDALRCLQRAKQRYPHDTEIIRWLTLVEQRIRQREAEFSR
jgi:hypothetical protein